MRDTGVTVKLFSKIGFKIILKIFGAGEVNDIKRKGKMRRGGYEERRGGGVESERRSGGVEER